MIQFSLDPGQRQKRQELKKTVKIVYLTIMTIVAIIVAALIAVQSPAVQTYMADKILASLKNSIDGDITIGKIHVAPFKAVMLKDVAVIDRHPFPDTSGAAPVDTFFSARYVTASLSIKNLTSPDGGIYLSSAKVTDGQFNLTIEPGIDSASSSTNLKRIFHLGNSDKNEEKKDKEVFSISNVKLEGMRFRMVNYKQDRTAYGSDSINWFDLDVCDINLSGRALKLKGPVMSGTCDKLSFREKSGFECLLLSGKAKVGNGKTIVDDLRIKDDWSDITLPSFVMSYKDTDSWSYFTSDVRMTGQIKLSIVSMKTLGYFAPALKNFRLAARLEGDVDGYVNDLSVKDIHIRTSDADGYRDWADHEGYGISGTITGSVVGLPDSYGMMTEATLSHIRFTSSGLEHFIKGWVPGASLNISNLCKGSRLEFSGRMRGPLNRLHVHGILTDGAGKVNANAHIFNVIDKYRPLEIGGTVQTESLDISRIVAGVPIGPCDMRAGLSATLAEDGPDVRIDSLHVDRLNALGYDYTGLSAAGTYSQEAFNGRIVCSDPNLNFLFQGIFTLSSKTNNALYKFYANLGYADLNALNIDKRGTSKVSFTTQANFTRVSGEDIIGNIDVNDILLEDDHGIHNIGDIEISSHARNDMNRVKFTSSFADISYVGSKFFASFMRDLQTVTTKKELPSLYRDPGSTWDGNRYDLSFRFHDTKDLLSFIAPGAYIADSTALTLSIDDDGAMEAELKSGRLAYKDKYLKGIDLRIDNSGKQLTGILNAGEVSASPILAKSCNLQVLADNDSIGLGFRYDNESELANRGEIILNGNIYRDDKDSLAVRANFLPSYIYFKSNLWKIASNDINIHKETAKVDSLALIGNGQTILLDGGWSASKTDTLRLNMDKFDISLVNAFTSFDMDIKGRVTGRAMLISPAREKTGLLMGIVCDSTGFGGREVGTLRVGGVWDEEKQGFSYACRNLLEGNQTFGANGNFYPKTKQIEGKLSLSGFDLGYAEPFLKSVFSSMDGRLSGDISFNGPLEKLEIDGNDLNLADGKLGVDFTKVTYNVSGPLSVSSSGLRFHNMDISDRFNAKGTVNGLIGWDHFRDMTFDTGIRFSKMEVLNLRESDNPSFYGNVSATGEVAITGPLNAIILSADAKTDKQGDFHIPLNTSSSAGTSNLLTFKEPYKEIIIDPYEEMMRRLKEKEKKSNDFGVRLKVNATPQVSANIEIDKAAGNVLTGYGNGLIDLDIRPSTGVFSINGNYSITSGVYHFVALGIAKRDFTIQDGSSVRFTGDVMDSDLNINALYKTKASVGTLIADTTSTSTRRTVECGIAITDKIKNPRLDFSINIPDLDPTTQGRVESALNTQDKVQKQLLALLLTNSFLPDEQSGVTNTSSSMLYTNVSEIMAGQLNNILQKLNIPLDFGLDYQQDVSGSNIFDVALSTALFNNRVIVNGTIGNRQYKSSTSSSDVVGDLDIDVKLDKPGAVRLNLFSHSADQYTNYLDNSQRNGIGLTYQKEFNTFGEMIRNMFRSRKRKQEIEAEKLQEQQNERQIKIRIEADDAAKKRRNGKKQQ